ncbi:uroporphyrinogen-III synthase [Novosphingobium umbonatum]|uniref:Uroporphyrinogen-III synthase n=1 Tax=Novosphingobium umbonatum TaxID=1908524 RepID=A0A3S2X7M4_9SPHN|nr:uroporphyrinogen-III synthase [Novosphingobium umbonatum]RVU07784.1 uroporphyrinogen-III synthase [Novosphingobium umbonatum]
MLPILVMRPEPGASATMALAEQMGLPVVLAPLFQTVALPWDAPAADAFDALLLGSANALRLGGPALAAYRGKPAYCVGDTTARAAEAAGLIVAYSGEGGLQLLLPHIDSRHARLLRLAARDRVTLDLPPEISMEEQICYASQALPMPEKLAAALAAPCIILLHSAEAARHCAAEAHRLGQTLAQATAITIGPRVSQTCSETGQWGAIITSPKARDADMLALAANLCHNGTRGAGGRMD